MESGEVFFGKPLPFFAVAIRPEIAGQAPDQRSPRLSILSQDITGGANTAAPLPSSEF
jgi:hypothetical protein